MRTGSADRERRSGAPIRCELSECQQYKRGAQTCQPASQSRRHNVYKENQRNPELRYTDEDMEYGHRLYRMGVRFVSDPLAIVYHHNEKSMTEYFRRAWRLSGQVDVRRVFELGQRNPQRSSSPPCITVICTAGSQRKLSGIAPRQCVEPYRCSRTQSTPRVRACCLARGRRPAGRRNTGLA